MTDERSRLDRILNRGGARVFNVQAKTLVDQFGNDIVDANGNKIWFPATFEPNAAIAFGKSLGRLPPPVKAAAMLLNFIGGGPWDLQRSYNGQSNAPFAEVFTRAASYALGLVGAAAGHSQTALMAGGGLHNLIANPKTAGLNFGNNPKNPPFIAQGFRDYFGPVFAPAATIPAGTFRGSPALSMPSDRIKTAFDHSFNGLPDNLNRLLASVRNGSVAPVIGFGDPAIAECSPGHSLSPAIVSSAPATSGGWLNSMIRNGEVERIAGSNGIGPSPVLRATPAFEPDATYSPDGYFIGSFPAASPAMAPPAVPSSINAPPQDRHDTFDDRYGSWASFAANAYGRDQSKVSVFDTGAPPIRYLSSRIIPSSSDRRGLVGSASDAFSPDTPGGLAGRIVALAGIDPANPDPRVLTPPENGFYNDELPQHWLFRALTGPLR